jgi:putative transposase
VLWAAQGESNSAIAGRLGWSMPTVGKWRRRFVEQRISGLHDELRAGRPRTYGDEQVAQLINRVLRSKPKNATHWSVRSVADQTGISKSTVARYFALFGLQPHRAKSFKLATDPFFVEKVRDVVGLYLNPPDKALVLCVDEKSQVQALERTQPVLPMGFGYIEGVTHDYYRHGTTTLFAALNVLDGSVITQCKPRHRHQEFLAFLNHLERNVPAGLEVHLIADFWPLRIAPRPTVVALEFPVPSPTGDSQISDARTTRAASPFSSALRSMRLNATLWIPDTSSTRPALDR